MLRCVMFDMDGTLADTLPLCIAAFRRSIEALSQIELTDREIADTFGPSEEGTIMALIPEHFAQGVALYLEYYEALHAELCPKPFEGVMELLRELRDSDVRLALVTGKGPRSLAVTLRAFHMESCFDRVETGNPDGPSKPQGIANVLRELGIRPEEAVYVGDAPSDILAAREASVPVFAAAWAQTADRAALERQRPNWLFTSVEELARHLRALPVV